LRAAGTAGMNAQAEEARAATRARDEATRMVDLLCFVLDAFGGQLVCVMVVD
jgi:hypothetical protein